MYLAAIIILAIVFLISGCQAETSALAPKSTDAAHIANVWWVMFGIGAVVYVIVMALMLLALFRRREHEADPADPTPPGSRAFVLISGVAIPAVILIGLFVLTLHTMRLISAPQDDVLTDVLTIEVTGHRWWWDVRYPQHGFHTANEIHIPAGEPVLIKLTSADVIHSFWVPELHGKTDMIPGKTNEIRIEAEAPGEYFGKCAEYCGTQHAHMAFYVVAEARDDFDLWLQGQQEPAPIPQNELVLEGQQIFLGSACVYCHYIEGTNARSRLGPDLTHFASRLTIGAGAVPNTRGNLAGWIIDSHAIKPGNFMPPMYLDGEELNALLVYMETLE